MKIMVTPAARGGIRSVVEAYARDGFIGSEDILVIRSYVDGSFLLRQLVFIRAFAQYLYYCTLRRPELAHIHAAMRGSFWRKSLFATAARLFGIPVVLHLHGSEMRPFYESQRPFAKKLIRRQLEKATRVIVLSESWRDFVQGIAPAARISVVPNYVVVPQASPHALRRPHQVLFLGLVGRRKGTFDLISAFAKVIPHHPDARLVIGGNGQIDQARSLIGDLGVGQNIELAGWIDGAAKQALLESSSIYVLPSYNEGLPMSVLEAMAAGLAIITTTVGGIPELITDGKDGLLVEPGDIRKLTDTLSTLLADPSMRQRLAEAGRKRVQEHYSDRAVLPLLHRIYNECKR